MTEEEPLIVRVQAVEAEDQGDLFEVTTFLRDELLNLDVADVRPVDSQDAPDGAKGVGVVAGWLAVQLSSGEAIRAVVEWLRGWSARRRREVEVSIGGDTIKLSAASATEQQRIIDAWIARHAAST